tara:strand:+ start:270 stop:674 length:405 start_codon:yes stop_codon:yes gene_type:complete
MEILCGRIPVTWVFAPVNLGFGRIIVIVVASRLFFGHRDTVSELDDVLGSKVRRRFFSDGGFRFGWSGLGFFSRGRRVGEIGIGYDDNLSFLDLPAKPGFLVPVERGVDMIKAIVRVGFGDSGRHGVVVCPNAD